MQREHKREMDRVIRELERLVEQENEAMVRASNEGTDDGVDVDDCDDAAMLF